MNTKELIREQYEAAKSLSQQGYNNYDIKKQIQKKFGSCLLEFGPKSFGWRF